MYNTSVNRSTSPLHTTLLLCAALSLWGCGPDETSSSSTPSSPSDETCTLVSDAASPTLRCGDQDIPLEETMEQETPTCRILPSQVEGSMGRVECPDSAPFELIEPEAQEPAARIEVRERDEAAGDECALGGRATEFWSVDAEGEELLGTTYACEAECPQGHTRVGEPSRCEPFVELSFRGTVQEVIGEDLLPDALRPTTPYVVGQTPCQGSIRYTYKEPAYAFETSVDENLLRTHTAAYTFPGEMLGVVLELGDERFMNGPNSLDDPGMLWARASQAYEDNSDRILETASIEMKTSTIARVQQEPLPEGDQAFLHVDASHNIEDRDASTPLQRYALIWGSTNWIEQPVIIFSPKVSLRVLSQENLSQVTCEVSEFLSNQP